LRCLSLNGPLLYYCLISEYFRSFTGFAKMHVICHTADPNPIVCEPNLTFLIYTNATQITFHIIKLMLLLMRYNFGVKIYQTIYFVLFRR
jgi:hypothetical protein